jgi:hemoglobin-like flavoprotein
MILDWFNAGGAVLFAQEKVRDINRLFPPTEQKGKVITAKVYQQKFDSLVVGIQTFSKKNKLNIYKKAKLLNTIKWEMKDAGHEEEIINEFISFIAPLL